MFCPACGARNSDDAKFCNQCGVRMASMAPITTGALPATSDAPSDSSLEPTLGPSKPPNAPSREPTPRPGNTLRGANPAAQTATADAPPAVNPTNSSIVLPLSGPSRRTMAIAGVCIALSGVAIGAGVAWRAFRRAPQRAAPAPQENIPQTAVGLVETPVLLPTASGDGGTRAGTTPSNGTTTGSRTGSTTTTGSRTGTTVASATTNARTRTTAASATGTRTAGGTTTTTTTTPARTTGTQGSTSSTGTPGSNTNTAQRPTPATGGGGGEEPGGGGEVQNPGGAIDPGDPGGMEPRGPSVGGYREGEETDATGRMDPQVFSYVYRHYRSQIASCHATASRGQEVVGTMRVRIRLGTDGHVVRTRIIQDTTNNSGLQECVQTQIRTWRYPQPEGGEVEFEYSFGFGS